MRILLATDGSEYSEEAAGFLTRFNFSPEDEIIVLHVISEIPYDDDYHAQIKRAIKRVAPKILNSAVQLLKPVKAKIETYEEEGYPDTTIIQRALNRNADLIVMGARGVKGVKLLFLGSSTRAVVINSPKPVLVVKRPPWRMSEKMKVLFATDGSETAAATGRFLASLPLPSDTEVAIMNIARTIIPDIPEKYIKETGEQITEDEERAAPAELRASEEIIGGARALLSGRFENIHALTEIGNPAREILEYEKIFEPIIIAVGCRGLRGFRGMMGSVSRRILGHSGSSVLVGNACGKPADNAEAVL